jgi:hypothetical protein
MSPYYYSLIKIKWVIDLQAFASYSITVLQYFHNVWTVLTGHTPDEANDFGSMGINIS